MCKVRSMSSELTLYVKGTCSNSSKTKELLDSLGIEYLLIDIGENPEVVDFLKSEGFLQTPVVMTDDDSWAGFQPDKLKKLASTKNEDEEW